MTGKEVLHLTLDAEPESPGAARAAFRALADELGIEEPGLGDLLLIVSEATSNAVRHAYPDGRGTIDLLALSSRNELMVIVRDYGTGFRAAVELEPTTLKLGLGLISTLTTHFEIIGH